MRVAYQRLKLKGDAYKGEAPGQWKVWSTKYDWRVRARAYDGFIDAGRIQMRLDRLGQLEHERFLFELQEQRDKQADVVTFRSIIASFQADQIKKPTLSQLAALSKQVEAIAAAAITGVRPASLKAFTGIQSMIAPEKPKIDETEIERLQKLTPAELDDYIRIRRRMLGEPGSGGGDATPAIAKQD